MNEGILSGVSEGHPCPGPLSVLFARDLRQFSGGHLKVCDYMGHVASTGWATPMLHLTPGSNAALADKWVPDAVRRVASVEDAHCYFIAGMDWRLFDAASVDLSGKLVVNLIQHVRHAEPGDPRYPFLSRPATRICVSAEVSRAIAATGVVNGPIETIPNGIDLVDLGRYRRAERMDRIFIGGLKNPTFALQCANTLIAEGFNVDLCIERLPRVNFLDRMAACEISVLLPNTTEGFFLPALEAMALGSLPVVPDCIGARGFCLGGSTALVPDYTVRSICDCASGLKRDTALRDRLRAGGSAMAARHSLEGEREQFLGLSRRHLIEAVRP